MYGTIISKARQKIDEENMIDDVGGRLWEKKKKRSFLVVVDDDVDDVYP